VVQRSHSSTKEARSPAQAPWLQFSASGPVSAAKKSSTAPPVQRNLTADPHYTTPTHLAPALPPIASSEASTLPTPTPSHCSLIPSHEPPQSLAAAVERIAVTPPQSLGSVCGSSDKSSESGYASSPEPTPVKPRPRTRTKAPKNGVPVVPILLHH
jgi:hypothetical protein